ncbi:MAG: site-2 protease family protein [Firmicutes bacterium]|nr:site-2 protease family protein [Bacillota bacterium]
MKFSIHPLFILIVLIAALSGWFWLMLSYVVVLILHELAHWLVARRLGYRLNKLTLMPYGAGISGSAEGMLTNHEILVAVAGPAFNLLLGMLTVALWWIYPTTYYYLEYFAIANFVTAAINLLPVFPLDGGRVALSLLGKKLPRKKVLRILKMVGIVISVCLIAAFTASTFFAANYSFLLLGLFVLISVIFETPASYYTHNLFRLKKQKSLKSGIAVRQIAVSGQTPVYKLLRHINNYSLTGFIIYSSDNKVVGLLNEFELQSLSETADLSLPLQHYFSCGRLLEYGKIESR